MGWWKAVSNTATCGVWGKLAMAIRMPSRLLGLCSGARAAWSAMAAMAASSMRVGAGGRAPPWTTRWPMPARSPIGPPAATKAPKTRSKPSEWSATRSSTTSRSPPPAPGPGGQPPPPLPDPLDQPRGQHLLTVHLEQLVLDGGRPGVDDQDPTHRGPAPAGPRTPPEACSAVPWAWMAVMATVLTMSATVAPRDRSLTGLRSPWRIGPTATALADRCTAL